MCQLQLIRTLTVRNGENNISAMNITSIHLINKFCSVFRNQKCYSTDLDAAFCRLPVVDTKIVGKFSNSEEGKHTSWYESHSSFDNRFKTFNSTDTGVYKVVRPGNVSPLRDVPDGIEKPSYTYTQDVPDLFQSQKNEIKLAHAINAMRESCRLAANILDKCGQMLKVWV